MKKRLKKLWEAKRGLAVLIVLVATSLTAFVRAQEPPDYDHSVYLPLVMGGEGTPMPTPTNTPIPTATPDPRGVFALDNALHYKGSSSVSEGYRTVGEIQNDTEYYVKNIQYTVVLRDWLGIVRQTSSQTLYWTIPPRGRACFKAVGRSGGPYTATAQVTLYELGDEDRVPEVGYSEVRAHRCYDGEVVRVDARLTNDEPFWVLSIIWQAALYDSSHMLVGCEVPTNGWPDRFGLAPGDSKEIAGTFSALHFGNQAMSIRFQSNGDVSPMFTPAPTPTPTPTIVITPVP